jgi:hypothetical protein
MRPKTKTIIGVTAALAASPLTLNADQGVLQNELPSVVKNIAQGVEAGNGLNTLKSELTGLCSRLC